ncbi:hypothetical protein [Phenylobacterium sp.]|uniref:hypothetical protein n=1 Tax=Phenylobacterium sp. TaxID=1871053 RepID=UPI0035ADAD72
MTQRTPSSQPGHRHAATVAGFALLLGSAAAAQPAPPRVVATHPAAGAVVPAGPLTLSVTFDRPMRTDGYSFIGGPPLFPDCAPKPTVSADRRTFTLDCKVVAGRSYQVGFNNLVHRNFVGEDGQPATPAAIRFQAR